MTPHDCDRKPGCPQAQKASGGQGLHWWLHHHNNSERLASDAEAAKHRGDQEKSQELYLQAAQAEEQALNALTNNMEKPRTRGITAVSATALYLKAGQPAKAHAIAKQCLSTDIVPPYFRSKLEEFIS